MQHAPFALKKSKKVIWPKSTVVTTDFVKTALETGQIKKTPVQIARRSSTKLFTKRTKKRKLLKSMIKMTNHQMKTTSIMILNV